MISHWHRLTQPPLLLLFSHTIPHIAPHSIHLFLAQTSALPCLTPFLYVLQHVCAHVAAHCRISSLMQLSDNITHLSLQIEMQKTSFHSLFSERPAGISRLAFDLLAEQTTPILNTHPEVCWASLPKPIVCPPLFMAPACLLASHSRSLHLYCLTWDNEKTKNVITLT